MSTPIVVRFELSNFNDSASARVYDGHFRFVIDTNPKPAPAAYSPIVFERLEKDVLGAERWVSHGGSSTLVAMVMGRLCLHPVTVASADGAAFAIIVDLGPL